MFVEVPVEKLDGQPFWYPPSWIGWNNDDHILLYYNYEEVGHISFVFHEEIKKKKINIVRVYIIKYFEVFRLQEFLNALFFRRLRSFYK